VILAVALAPTPGQVALGVLAVLGGALIAAVSAFLARRSRNWLHHLGTVGGLLIVAGVIGQRTVAGGAAVGPWDAGITVPVIAVHLDPVAAAGIILCLLGLTVTLLFERVIAEADRPRPLVHRALEDDDAI
jgi:formate hydrogenlyase subunit 3/multisubunit Na+/H+ antiporter MnhD subunit